MSPPELIRKHAANCNQWPYCLLLRYVPNERKPRSRFLNLNESGLVRCWQFLLCHLRSHLQNRDGIMTRRPHCGEFTASSSYPRRSNEDLDGRRLPHVMIDSRLEWPMCSFSRVNAELCFYKEVAMACSWIVSSTVTSNTLYIIEQNFHYLDQESSPRHQSS
jgi:hypothetical protein